MIVADSPINRSWQAICCGVAQRGTKLSLLCRTGMYQWIAVSNGLWMLLFRSQSPPANADSPNLTASEEDDHKEKEMQRLRSDDPALDFVAGGTDQYNAAVVDAAERAYDYNNPTQGVTNFQHPSTVYADGTTMSSAWIPQADLYVFENYDATNGQPVEVTFDYDGNGYNPNNMGGVLDEQYLTAYGAQEVSLYLQDGSTNDVVSPGEWVEEYADAGGTVEEVD
ncbi:hypothetical protein JUN65_04415 [Gluconacetobacter azotocaptans]|uniref:hypothetical protein n=1 Tax=Gluconacetobacter azotocaptans TaxID=142834 RepID=UPI00195D0CED|nr:hypothetical protein [Gluconacetobacter azotocaptans]MBM9400826.1 hypothetical protein [Gluconacetobacter azotocaptans]